MGDFLISDAELHPDPAFEAVRDPECGAVASFVGTVRGTNEGRRVLRLEYEGYEPVAVAEGARIIAEAKEKFPFLDAHCVHRTGMLEIKEESGHHLDLFFHNGQIWSVDSDTDDHEEAFYSFLSWTRGKFNFEPKDAPGERTFMKDTTSLLLEGMKRLDDASAAAGSPLA